MRLASLPRLDSRTRDAFTAEFPELDGRALEGAVAWGDWGAFRVVDDDGAEAGAALFRIDPEAGGSAAFVILYAIGRAARPLTARALPLFEREARRLGCDVLEFQTQRAGLVSAAFRAGYGARVVLRRELAAEREAA